jgi:RimJ/RimL family protein N-acetyltransferase
MIARAEYISEFYAGAYPDNIGSRRMLEKCGYVRFPQDDLRERHCLTGEEIIQWGYVLEKNTVLHPKSAIAPNQ